MEVKYCEDTRLRKQLEASAQQHSELCKHLQGATVTLHTILLGVGGVMYVPHTVTPLKQLGINDQRSKKLALKLHVHSVQYANKFASTRHALELTYENLNNHGLDQGAASHLPDPH